MSHAFLSVRSGVGLLVGPALVLGLTASFASAQTIRGILQERETYRLIDLGTVYMLDEDGDTVAAALSNEDGFFFLAAPEPGSYRVVGHALGYIAGGAGPFELGEDVVRVVQLPLLPAPIPVEGIDVETTRIVISDDLLLANGFYDRMMAGTGQFLTPEDIEQSNARYTPHLFRALKYIRPQYGASGWRIWPDVWSPIGGGSCKPRVWIDGVWVNRAGHEQYEPGSIGLEDMVARDDVRAAELYWGLQAPLRYGAPDGNDSGLCGVILIWTKA